MVNRTYECDLCHDNITVDASGKCGAYGVYWTTNKAFEFKSVYDAERHLCLNCIQSLLAACERHNIK